jgi:hypothetical protein
MAVDIIFFSLAGPVGDYTGAHTVIFRGFFSINYLQKEERSCDGQAGGGGGLAFFRAPNCLQVCDRWGEGRGILYIKASNSPSSGLKRTILFLEISRGFLCIFRRKDHLSCDGWAA